MSTDKSTTAKSTTAKSTTAKSTTAKSTTAKSDKSFVDQVVKDPANLPDVLLLSGFLGSSSEEEHTRCYFDVHLTSYVDIPDSAILYRQDNSFGPPSLGGSLLWIECDAELVYGKPAGSRSKAGFLQGSLAQAYPTHTTQDPQMPPNLSSDQAGGENKGEQEMNTTLIGCTGWYTCPPPPSAVPHCPTVYPVCSPNLYSAPPNCPTVQHCPPTWNCPVSAPPNCLLSAPPACPTAPPGYFPQPDSAPPNCPTVQTCPQTWNCPVSAPPNCPTVQACPPTWNCPPPPSAPPHCPTVQHCPVTYGTQHPQPHYAQQHVFTVPLICPPTGIPFIC